MVIILHPGSEETAIQKLIDKIESMGVKVNRVVGESYSILGLIGDTSVVDIETLEANEVVERVVRVQEPYKRANRLWHPEDTVIEIKGRKIGGSNITVMAGPCSIESEEQIFTIAEAVAKSGASFLRGGAFKPRSSPYSFQGMGEEGLKLMNQAGAKYNLPIVTEVMSISQIDIVGKYADLLQIGARNMQNFELLKELGQCGKPILLKRGLSATIEELLMAAEYILAGGNEEVILCERGIRTFEPYTRNTLDLSIVPAVKRLSHLPIIIDPSHATGHWWMVEPMSMASIAAGADGVIVEVHNDPKNAKSDGAQSLKPKKFDTMIEKLKVIANLEGRSIS